MIYAGIGSRKTPEDICRKMHNAGRAIAKLNGTLRSGGASGADKAFETGCDTINGDKEIYLPYKNFNGNSSPLYGTDKTVRLFAKKFHPNWNALSSRGHDFMGRNVYQVLGHRLDTPADFILCWTPNGDITGGTGQALRIAVAYDIPIFNFATDEDDDISDFIFALAERKRV